MRPIDRLLSRWKYPEQRIWFAVAAIAAILAVLVALTSASYSNVLLARTGVSLVPSQSIVFTNTSAAGALLDGGSVTLTLRLTVSNPSGQRLRFTSIAYKSWIEDLPSEAGIVTNRPDDLLTNATGTHRFYLAFLDSVDVDAPTVPGYGTSTLTLAYNLNRSSDSERFAAVQNITEFAANTRGSGTVSPWVHWVLLTLTLIDLPPPSATAAQDLTNMARVVIQEGPNLGS